MGKKGSCMETSSGDNLDNNELMICRIMQKFRPIAPKPLSDSGNALSNCDVSSPKKSGRVKRKYSRKKVVSKKNNILFKKNEEYLGMRSGSIDDKVVTTLQLLPSKSESSQILKGCCLSSSKSSSRMEDVQGDPVVDELKTLLKCPYDFLESSSSSPGGKEDRFLRVAETCIIVECITGVYMEFHNNLLLGLSDNEKINHLQLDLRPCFVSDNLDNVVFVNEAYKKMVMKNNFLENNNKWPTELKVELVMKEKVPNWFPKAFSCTARFVQYKWWGGRHEKFSRTVPCDVWRMDIGGLAWKLDTKTALGLAL